MQAISPVSQTRHEPVTVRRVLLPVGSPGVEQYAAMQVPAPGRDLFDHLDQLKDVLTAGWHVPLATRRLVDRATALELIDQLRLCVPEQVRAAQQLLEQREQVLAAAYREAAAVLTEARQQANRRLGEGTSLQAAARRATQIEEEAWRTAEQIERQGEQAAAERLRTLRAQLAEMERVLAQQLPSPEWADDSRAHTEADTSIGRSASGTWSRWAA